MKFELHGKVRWEPEPMSRQAYFTAMTEYYRHLSRLDFSTNKTLLRYFGDSFFHNAEVRKAHFDSRSSVLELQIARSDDLEDINNYRKRRRFVPIPRYRYLKKPVVYECRFTSVTIGPEAVKRLRNPQRAVTVIDTEILKRDQKNKFVVLLSLGPNKEIEFTCESCSVRIRDRRRVFEYTGGLSRQLPRCTLCRSKLLNKAKVIQLLHDTREKRTLRGVVLA